MADMTTDEDRPIAMVAQFIVMPRRRLELNALTVFKRKRGYRGERYIGREEYDVDRSKKYGYIFDQSGFGGGKTVTVNGVYHVWGDVEIKEEQSSLVDPSEAPPWTGAKTVAIRERNRTRRIEKLPRAFMGYGKNLLEWLERNGIQEKSVWCSECGDCMPGTGYDDCEHVWWCDKIGWYSTPDDRCGCSDREECNNDA